MTGVTNMLKYIIGFLLLIISIVVIKYNIVIKKYDYNSININKDNTAITIRIDSTEHTNNNVIAFASPYKINIWIDKKTPTVFTANVKELVIMYKDNNIIFNDKNTQSAQSQPYDNQTMMALFLYHVPLEYKDYKMHIKYNIEGELNDREVVVDLVKNYSERKTNYILEVMSGV